MTAPINSFSDNEYAIASVHNANIEPELCWVDFETTGLESNLYSIPLEVGVIITDRWARPRASFQSLIMERGWQLNLNRAPSIVRDMHVANGLEAHLQRTEKLLVADGPSPAHEVLSAKSVNAELFDFLHEHGGGEGKMPMVGSTINFDRHFMRGWLRDCDGYLHYRNVDISSLKVLCKLLNPAVYEKMDTGTAPHRTIPDLLGSIRDFTFYRENFLFEA